MLSIVLGRVTPPGIILSPTLHWNRSFQCWGWFSVANSSGHHLGHIFLDVSVALKTVQHPSFLKHSHFFDSLKQDPAFSFAPWDANVEIIWSSKNMDVILDFTPFCHIWLVLPSKYITVHPVLSVFHATTLVQAPMAPCLPTGLLGSTLCPHWPSSHSKANFENSHFTWPLPYWSFSWCHNALGVHSKILSIAWLIALSPFWPVFLPHCSLL